MAAIHHRFVCGYRNLSEDLSAVLFDLRFHLREFFGSAPRIATLAPRARLMCGAATDAAATGP